MTLSRIATTNGSVIGTIERRTWRWLIVRELDGDVIEIAARYVVSIESGPALEAGVARAREMAARMADGPKPALSAEERDRLLAGEYGA